MKEIRNLSEKEVFVAGQYKKEKMYWLDKLSGNLVKSNFPYDYKKTGKNNEPEMNTVVFALKGELFAKLMDITSGLDHRLHMFLAAALVILLGKYTGNHDIIFGTPIYKQEIEGEFINTVLTLRNKLENNMSFRDVLLQVRQTLMEAVENQNYPLQALLYQLDNQEYLPGKECWLFDVVILLENIHDEKYLEEISPNIIFSFLKTHERVKGVLKYNSLLYDGSTLERISTHFNNLLQEVVFNRNIRTADINILSPKEKEQLLFDFNDNYLEYPQDKTAAELFELQAAKNPDNAALVEVLNPARLRDCSQLTYQELNKKANQLARLLRTNGVQSGSIVGIVLERSLEMLIGILGIWKAGGAYLPINPETPRNRILTIIQDCQVSIILTMSGIFKKDVSRVLLDLRSQVTIPFKTGFRPQIKDFDGLPFPNRSLVNYEKYNKYIGQALVKNSIALQATRGCPYLCSYCHKIWPKNSVTRSAENIFAEVKQYYQIGVWRFVFVDDIFNFNIKNSRRFFEMVIENEMDVQFFFPNGLRGDLLTKEYIDLMVKAGTVDLALALETASPRLQKLIKKNLHLGKLRENIEYLTLKYPHVILELFTMHGFPTETKEEAMGTLDFIKSIKWLHFPYVSILKIYPGTDIEKLALANGISSEAIADSDHLAAHELPDTLPFDRRFTLQYQSDFLNNYFLSRERLMHVLPYQMKLLTEDEMVQKYNSFLPTDIGSFADLLDFVGITAGELGADAIGFVDEEKNAIPHLNREMRKYFPLKEMSEKAFRVLVLDLSQLFTADSHILYDIVEPPLGAMYLVTYLNHRLGNKINGRIAKSRVDFDNYLQLKALLEEFKPDVIGIRTLSFFKDFFHKTVAVIRQWGIQTPIISGGPYATSSYSTLLQDRGVDLAVLGEGEETFCELIEKMIDNGGKLPGQKELENIIGIAFIPAKADLHQTGQPMAIMMDTFIQLESKESSNNLDLTNQSRDLAYVIFTSGSTGKPKGTMMEHISVNNLLYGLKDEIYKNYGFPLRVAIVAPFEFDASIQQISGALLQGHCLYIVPEETRVDGARLLEFYRKYNINISDGTPTHIRLLLETLEERVYLPFIKHFIIAGEVLPIEVTRNFLKGFRENTPRISNMYGPTETCVDSTFYHISPGILEMLHTIPIGKPLPNQQVYIVDKENQLQPIGVVGELTIGGDGVARGYLNRPDLTAEKFDQDLWDYQDYHDKKLLRGVQGGGFLEKSPPGRRRQKIYKTGDLARWLADGNIEFLGRIDHQVKIRGFRIELGEIESQLRVHECIKDAVVVAVEDEEGDRSLCAYYVEKAGEGIEVWPSVGEYFVWDDLLYYAMTNDKPRNRSYKVAIDKLVRDKTVVEIGTGPDAILARFCAQAGVKKVYAIEILEESYKKARQTVRRLNLEEKITVIHGDATAVQLPEKVDVCLSQIIGNIASSEGAIHILNHARRFLKKDGVMIPAACQTKIAAVQLPEEIHENPGFSEISKIYPDKIFKAFGYKFDFRICIKSFPQSGVISNVETFENLNFSRLIDAENSRKVEFTIYRNARIDGFLLWINLYTTENEVIDTSENKYVWSPVFIPVFYPGVDVSAGDMVRAECIRTPGNSNICPDYKIKGRLIFKNGENLDFEYDFPYLEQGYRKNSFYQKLFNADSINVVDSGNTEISINELKEYLGKNLPDYLIPSYFVQLEGIPLSKNGKVDIKALVRPEFVVVNEYAAPRDEIEKKLAAIWAEVLSIEKDKIGIDSNFFDLGGHSLKATRFAAKMHKELNIQLPLVDIFSKSTIRELANYLRETAPDSFVPFTPIQPVEKKEFHTLSSAQKRLFILKQMKEDSIGYNTRTSLVLLGNLERENLEETFRRIIKRHECLRTSFGIVEDKPVQRVHDEVEFAIEYYDLSRKTGRPGDREEVMPDSVIEAFFRPFDLSRAPLSRVGLIKQGESRHLLIIETHHIISDGTSVAIFVKDFIALYSNEELPPLRIQYKDYSQWQNSSEQKELIKKQEEYWVNEFKVQVPILNLPLDFTRPAKQSFEGNTLHFGIGKETSIKLRELAAAEGVTLFILLLAIYNLLLFKLSGQEDIVVGTGIEGRRHEDLRQIIGMMLNTLCFRNRPQEEKTFYQFLKEVKENTLQAFENQEYPFENLVEKVTVTRDTSRNPLFDVLFQLNNMETSRLEIPGIKIKPYESKLDISKLDITLFVHDGREELFFALEYCTRLFKETTIKVFIRYFQEIASSVLENPNRKLWEIIEIPKERKEKILFQLNDELKNEVNDINKSIRPIQTRLNKNLEINRDKVALEYGSHFITNAMLDRRSNYIANWLINQGMNKETPIGILMSDRMELVSSIIGILKAGCVFVPLDANHPPDRLALMIHSIGLKNLIVQGDDFNGLYTNDIFINHSPDMIIIDDLFSRGNASWFDSSPAVHYNGEDKIYIYFTSGTTGTPTAILGKNRSLVHFIDWQIERLHITHDFRVSQLMTPGFDAFLKDVLVPLFTGGVICIPGQKGILADPIELIDWIHRCRIHLVHCVPSVFRLLIPGTGEKVPGNIFNHLKFILLSGETVTHRDLTRWYGIFKERIQLVNFWGPTETTLVRSCYFIRESDIHRERIPVGKPIKGARVMVLNKNLRICDELVTGELYIRTPFSTYGYINNPVLFRQRFLPDPFSDGVDADALMYKTGDLGRMLPDGNLEFLGRIDRQLKIQGVRIEPGEIEHVLISHPGVKEAVVVMKKLAAGSDLLCAYITVTRGKTLVRLRDFLRKKLPFPMIPAKIIELDSIPRKPNGKIDYDSLPDPLLHEQKADMMPGNDLEKRLEKLWSQVLGLEKISINDHFFELGGNSLKAMSLVSKIHREFAVKIPLLDVFDHSTIQLQAEIIKNARKDKYTDIRPVEKREYYELSLSQRRVWVLNQLEEASLAFNMLTANRLQGEVNLPALRKVFAALLERHESLRTVFIPVGDNIKQKIIPMDEIKFNLETIDLRNSNQKETEARDLAELEANLPFDLSNVPLLRVKLIQLEKYNYVFLLTMHHIISDMLSNAILRQEVFRLYDSYEKDEENPLKALRIQYKDYAAWQSHRFQGEFLKKNRDYWLKQFSGNIPLLKLPLDRESPNSLNPKGEIVGFLIDEELSGQLKILGNRHDATLFMIILTTMNILLHHYSGQSDIVIGTPIAGREHNDLQNQIGFYLNLLPLRTRFDAQDTFSKLLGKVKTAALEAFEHQAYPFDMLVEDLGGKRDIYRHPLFDVLIDMANYTAPGDTGIQGRLKVQSYTRGQKRCKFYLVVYVEEKKNTIHIHLEYNTDIFQHETIVRMSERLQILLEGIIKNPGSMISDFQLDGEYEIPVIQPIRRRTMVQEG